MRAFIVTLLCTLLIAACTSTPQPMTLPDTGMPNTPIPVDAVPTIDPANERLADAQFQYNFRCAHCHGYGGEGQIEETVQQTINLGYHTVPAHDASGHTWQHADQVLFEVIKYGVQNPTNLYTMGAFGTTLTDDQIFAVIDYMKVWWTDEQRDWQAQLTAQFTENNPYWEETNLDTETTEEES